MTTAAKRPLVVIGTSGSHDYLKDTTGEKRFWPVREPSSGVVEPVSPEDRARLDAYLAATSGSVVVATVAAGEGDACDGIHDEGAPLLYLCTRCFPDLRGDLPAQEDDGYEDARQTNDQEME